MTDPRPKSHENLFHQDQLEVFSSQQCISHMVVLRLMLRKTYKKQFGYTIFKTSSQSPILSLVVNDSHILCHFDKQKHQHLRRQQHLMTDPGMRIFYSVQLYCKSAIAQERSRTETMKIFLSGPMGIFSCHQVDVAADHNQFDDERTKREKRNTWQKDVIDVSLFLGYGPSVFCQAICQTPHHVRFLVDFHTTSPIPLVAEISQQLHSDKFFEMIILITVYIDNI